MVSPARSAVIVGAGIGGLCAAIALHQTGWSVTVLEQRREGGAEGAGISLWPNAMRVLDRFGIAEQVLERSAPLSEEGGLRLPSGQWVTRAKPGDAPLMEVALLHRAELQAVLRSALPDDCISSGVQAEGLDGAGAGTVAEGGRLTVRARDSAGSTGFAADLVVAADGVHSTLRETICPSAPPPVYSGHTTWRGVTPSGSILASGGGETWGYGAKFGYLPLSRERIYWFAELNAPPGTRHDDEQSELLRRFKGWHAPIGEIIRATPRDRILRLDVEYLPDLPSYVRGAAALLGDAAHAMTPDLGQGGCQAIEDAAVLAAHLAAHRDIPTALRRYDAERRPRTQAIARAARRMGQIGQLSNPLAVALRNAAIRLTPPRAAIRPLARISGWTPPPLPPASA